MANPRPILPAENTEVEAMQSLIYAFRPHAASNNETLTDVIKQLRRSHSYLSVAFELYKKYAKK